MAGIKHPKYPPGLCLLLRTAEGNGGRISTLFSFLSLQSNQGEGAEKNLFVFPVLRYFIHILGMVA
jgi:hypothetical protein